MARKNDLAKLAALAGLGMVLTNQYRNKVDLTEKDSNPDRKARPDPTETREAPFKATNESAYTSTTKNNSNAAKNIGFGGGDNSDKDLKRVAPAEPAPVKPLKSDVVTSSNLPPVVGNADFGNEGYKSQSPILKAINQANGADSRSANRSDELANVSRAVKRESKTNQFAQEVPYQESSQKTDALAVASRATRAAEAKRRAANQRGYKSGGMVAKASSASSRADGIASKGKTRGKIC